MADLQTAFADAQKPAVDELMAAIRANDAEKVRNLLARGADPDEESEAGHRPLTTAASLGCTEIMEILIDAKADINTTNKYGYTPLISAALEGQTAAVKLLIEHNAKLNERTNEGGQTALMCVVAGVAPIEDCLATMRLLIEAGADLELRSGNSGNGNTALKIAENGGKEAAIEMLKEAPALQARIAAEKAAAAQQEAMHETAVANQDGLKKKAVKFAL